MGGWGGGGRGYEGRPPPSGSVRGRAARPGVVGGAKLPHAGGCEGRGSLTSRPPPPSPGGSMIRRSLRARPEPVAERAERLHRGRAGSERSTSAPNCELAPFSALFYRHSLKVSCLRMLSLYLSPEATPASFISRLG
ncbi:unnamed protein product [Eretmochelys imbricata]